MKDEMGVDYSMLTSRGAILEDGYLWLLLGYFDAIVKIDWNSKKVDKIYSIPSEKHIDFGYIKMVKVGMKIYVFPHVAEEIFMLDIELEKFEKIEVDFKRRSKNLRINIAETIDNKIIFAGMGVYGIYILDTVDNQIDVKYDYLQLLEEKGVDITLDFDNGKYLFGQYSCVKENVIYIPLYFKNYIVAFDLTKQESIIYDVCEECEIITITRVGKSFILSTVREESFIWSPIYGISEKLISNSQMIDVDNSNSGFYSVISINDNEYYVPAWKREIYKKENNRIKSLFFDYPDIGNNYPEVLCKQYEALFFDERYIYIQARSNGQIFSIDSKTDAVESIKINITKEDVKRISQSAKFQTGEIYIERYAGGLEIFIEKLLNN